MPRLPSSPKTKRPSISKDDPATAYARKVSAGKIVAGPMVRGQCDRHLRDLETGGERGLYWDLGAVKKALGFFADVLRLNGGEHEGRPFTLEPWQAFIVGSLFGWKTADGFRRFRVAFIEIAKSNGKSPLAAGIGILMFMADGEARAEVYSAATKKDQAMILFRDAVAMVDQSPALSRRVNKSGVGEKVWNLADLRSGSWFRPISADSGQSGPRVHCGLIDEVHEHKNSGVVDMMRAGTKGRTQALIIEITNSGVDRNSVCYQHHEYSERVATGVIEDDSWFTYVCGLDEGDDPFEDESCWEKANPNLGVSVSLKYIREQVREARGMPAKGSIVKRLNFCEWQDAVNPWVEGELWLACESEFDIEELAGRDCHAAIDLSAKRDLTALALSFPDEETEESDPSLTAFVEFWTPKDTLIDRSRADKVPYDLWARQGHIHAVPGKSIDYAWVAERLGVLQAQFNILSLAFDPWRIDDLLRELDAAGVDAWIYEGEDKPQGTGIKLIGHSQGFQGGDSKHRLWMPRSVDEVESLVVNGLLRVKKNPALTYCSSGAVLETDAKGNRVFTKRKSYGRIDGIVALTMAAGAASAGVNADSGDGILITVLD